MKLRCYLPNLSFTLDPRKSIMADGIKYVVRHSVYLLSFALMFTKAKVVKNYPIWLGTEDGSYCSQTKAGHYIENQDRYSDEIRDAYARLQLTQQCSFAGSMSNACLQIIKPADDVQGSGIYFESLS